MAQYGEELLVNITLCLWLVLPYSGYVCRRKAVADSLRVCPIPGAEILSRRLKVLCAMSSRVSQLNLG